MMAARMGSHHGTRGWIELDYLAAKVFTCCLACLLDAASLVTLRNYSLVLPTNLCWQSLDLS